ncbi:hypothetical protein ABT063_26485 [Streptomyces sp. NPDC002838]|uniref:hypothetical protein n=1 Tax=Streptomyces sp. NPDC002838 TaxID=3154436 RepID=UPI0033289BE8
MDAELMALASTAGTAVVTALTTDAWERTELLEVRELLEGPGADALAEAMADDWRADFLHLLAARPDVAQDVRRVPDEVLLPSLPSQPHPAPVVFNAGPAER